MPSLGFVSVHAFQVSTESFAHRKNFYMYVLNKLRLFVLGEFICILFFPFSCQFIWNGNVMKFNPLQQVQSKVKWLAIFI